MYSHSGCVGLPLDGTTHAGDLVFGSAAGFGNLLHGLEQVAPDIAFGGFFPAGIEATAVLQDVRFDAAITRDGRSQGDRFNISAQVESPVREGGS